jgi:hypothetical protein
VASVALERSGIRGREVSALERRSETALRDAQRAIAALQRQTGAIIENVELGTTPAEIDHPLGRPPVGCIVAQGLDGTFDLAWSDARRPERRIVVSATAGSPVVRLWVW